MLAARRTPNSDGARHEIITQASPTVLSRDKEFRVPRVRRQGSVQASRRATHASPAVLSVSYPRVGASPLSSRFYDGFITTTALASSLPVRFFFLFFYFFMDLR